MFFGDSCVVYLAPMRIFIRQQNKCSLNMLLGEVLNYQIEEPSETKWCTLRVAGNVLVARRER